MPLLAATNIEVSFGHRVILDGVSITIEPGERIGIVGRNGTGKTTLLKVLTGQIPPDRGGVSLQRGSRAGYLQQDPKFDPTETLRESAETAFVELHDLHRKVHRLYEEIAEASARGDHATVEELMKQQTRLEHQVEEAGGYAVDHKIDSVLHGLGFTDAQFSIMVAGLSGGQKGRLALATLLLEEPDILLLDEPTNHLDIDGRLWLEAFLKDTFRGAVAMVSHDRYLLDNVVTRIIEVEQGRLIDYPGNYATFRELRTERRTAMLRAYENQQDKFKKEMEFILKYKAGQRAKEARGRLTKLERAKDSSSLERPMEMSTFKLQLPTAPRSGDIVVAARGISKSYTRDDGTEKVLFKDLDISIARGERWGVIGPNGAGKTTLVRCLLGEMEPDGGVVKPGANLAVGHYKQTHEHLDGDLSVIRYLQKVILKECPGQVLSEQQARNLAGAFLFSGDEQERTLGSLSGGERSRAVLAGLLASAKNLLVLDEPTNHLDIPSAERLEEALSVPDEEGEGYEGTLLLISHDRALIDATCDHLLVFDGEWGVEIFLGNYSLWHEREVGRRRDQSGRQAEEKARRQRDEAKERAAAEAKKRKASQSAGPSADSLSRMKTEQIEARIEKIQARMRELDELLGDPDVWRNHGKAHGLGEERKKLAADLEPLEFEWSRRAAET